MSLTEYVADFVMNPEHEDIPKGVQRTVKEYILDDYGLALSGCEKEERVITGAARSDVLRVRGAGRQQVESPVGGRYDPGSGESEAGERVP